MADATLVQDQVNKMPVKLGFTEDFKSCALWTLIGVVGGVMLGVWLCQNKTIKY